MLIVVIGERHVLTGITVSAGLTHAHCLISQDYCRMTRKPPLGTTRVLETSFMLIVVIGERHVLTGITVSAGLTHAHCLISQDYCRMTRKPPLGTTRVLETSFMLIVVIGERHVLIGITVSAGPTHAHCLISKDYCRMTGKPTPGAARVLGTSFMLIAAIAQRLRFFFAEITQQVKKSLGKILHFASTMQCHFRVYTGTVTIAVT